ncbi:MAG: hypothetical protein JXR95_04675 [Deltaproteobacteria bacterium]|nr:hypothetical protein [Deltaproteobacteria bacterium]
MKIKQALLIFVIMFSCITCNDDNSNEIYEICNNKIDDDENGYTDCDDPACSLNPLCQNTAIYCGDGTCNGSENTTNCSDDCGTLCGDGTCNGSENTTNCSDDCGTLCGDGACNGSENTTNCSDDCGVNLGTYGDARDSLDPVTTSLELPRPLTTSPTGDLFSNATKSVPVFDSYGFFSGDKILILVVKGIFNQDNVGKFEIRTIQTIDGNTLNLDSYLENTYTLSNEITTIVRITQLGELRITSGGILTVPDWDGETGGILAIMVSGPLYIDGKIDLSGKGLRGGSQVQSPGSCPAESFVSESGEGRLSGWPENQMSCSDFSEFGNGGMGCDFCCAGNGAGGGGNITSGSDGTDRTTYTDLRCGYGTGGEAAPFSTEDRLLFGSGGGTSIDRDGGLITGGNGGGIVLILANELTSLNGEIISDGFDGYSCLCQSDYNFASGAGAGGTIMIVSPDVSPFQTDFEKYSFTGGRGGTCPCSGANGGNGGDGQVVFSEKN